MFLSSHDIQIYEKGLFFASEVVTKLYLVKDCDNDMLTLNNWTEIFVIITPSCTALTQLTAY